MSHEEPPTSAQEREERIRRLVRAYEQQLRQELPSGPQTLEQIERKADEIGQAVKKGIQKKVSQAQGTGYAGVVLACACGKPVRYIADYARCLVTLHGPLCVARAYYHGRACKHGFFPLNSVLQIGARSCSVAVQALVCRFAAFLAL